MKQLAERYGYKYVGNCNCEGFQTDKYINGEYQLRIRTRNTQFKIKHQGRSITQWVPISQLETALTNIHHVAVQA